MWKKWKLRAVIAALVVALTAVLVAPSAEAAPRPQRDTTKHVVQKPRGPHAHSWGRGKGNALAKRGHGKATPRAAARSCTRAHRSAKKK